MLDKNLLQSTSSWPFVEIRKLIKDRKDKIKSEIINSNQKSPKKVTIDQIIEYFKYVKKN